MTDTIFNLPRLNSADAAKYLLTQHGIKVEPSTLKQWAWRGGGPAFQKSGQRRLYPIDQLDAWAAKRLTRVVASTSELWAALEDATCSRSPDDIPDTGDSAESHLRPRPPPRPCFLSNALEKALEDNSRR